MKNDLAIKVENLGKKYQIGKQQKYLTLRDQITEIPKKIFSQKKNDEFWALKNVSFEVKKGEVLGVIGSNGAGKSTLLKILARITEPTKGTAIMRRRVASMLEIGTGFHQELTGRENIFLNGAILGMTKKEIQDKFVDIVEFSGIEKFIDTPVKHYSSGMYVRLAFSIVAHLDSDILLIDEVLAVGDAAFQKKSARKLHELAKSRRTVIFISHNMNSISNLCDRAIYLKNGEITIKDETQKVINRYFDETSAKNESSGVIHPGKREHKHKAEYIKIKSVSITNLKGEKTPIIGYTEPFTIQVEGKVKKPIKNVRFGISLEKANGLRLSTMYSKTQAKKTNIKPGNIKWSAKINNPLNPGIYRVGVNLISSIGGVENLPSVLYFEISDSKKQTPNHDPHSNGIITIKPRWKFDL